MRVAQACPNQGVRKKYEVSVVSGQSCLDTGRKEGTKVGQQREENCREVALMYTTKPD